MSEEHGHIHTQHRPLRVIFLLRAVAVSLQEQGSVGKWEIFLTEIRDLTVPGKMTLDIY